MGRIRTLRTRTKISNTASRKRKKYRRSLLSHHRRRTDFLVCYTGVDFDSIHNQNQNNNNNNNNNNKCSCKSSFQFNEETKKTTCEIVKNDPSYQYSNICGYTIRNKKNIYDFLNIRVSDIVQKKDYDYDDTNNNNNIDNENKPLL